LFLAVFDDFDLQPAGGERGLRAGDYSPPDRPPF